jgi:hypothetical protein
MCVTFFDFAQVTATFHQPIIIIASVMRLKLKLEYNNDVYDDVF